MYLGLVLSTDISCHKAATVFIPCSSLSFRLSPLPHPASFNIWEVDCMELVNSLSCSAEIIFLGIGLDQLTNTRRCYLFSCRLTESANCEAMVQHIITIFHIGWVDWKCHECNDTSSVACRYDDAEDPVPS
jgi:hypothetical protein